MKDSFVFYESFYDILQMLPDVEDWRTLIEAVCEYAFTDKHEPLPNPMLEIAFKHFQISIDSSSKRYQKAVEDGKKGGRPSGFVHPSVWVPILEQTHSIPKTAKKIDRSPNTLRNYISILKDSNKAEFLPYKERVQKLKNLSVSVSVSDSDAVADSESDKRNNLKASDTTTTDPNGSSPCQPRTRILEWCPPD